MIWVNKEYKTMKIKKKKRLNIILFLLIPIVFSLIFALYYFLTDDEYHNYTRTLRILPSVQEDKDSFKVDIKVSNYNDKTGRLNILLINNKEIPLSLPSRKLKAESNIVEGNYTLSLYFKKYPLLFNNEKYLSGWKLEKKSVQEETIGKEDYVTGLKGLISLHPIREAYHCSYHILGNEIKEWECMTDLEQLNYQYLKSIYLIFQLSERLNDSELAGYVEEEIKYLNNNIEKYLTDNYNFPQAYILKLVDIGLDAKYLDLVDINSFQEFGEIPDSEIKLENRLEQNQTSLEPTNPYNYVIISQYADNAKIFKEYEQYKDLIFFHNQGMIAVYNSSNFIFSGLCTIGYQQDNEELFSKLKSKLEEMISTNEFDKLLIRNIPELIRCKDYAVSQNSDIRGFDELVEKAVIDSTDTNKSGSFIVGLIESEVSFSGYKVIFSLIDNLMFILDE